MTSDYPEHEKLAAISDDSQTIGEFLDFGLARMGLTLYETREVACECSPCRHAYWLDHDTWGFHTAEECERARREERAVQVETTDPTHRTIQAILADYFGIDQSKIDAEKEAMLEAMRR